MELVLSELVPADWKIQSGTVNYLKAVKQVGSSIVASIVLSLRKGKAHVRLEVDHRYLPEGSAAARLLQHKYKRRLQDVTYIKQWSCAPSRAGDRLTPELDLVASLFGDATKARPSIDKPTLFAKYMVARQYEPARSQNLSTTRDLHSLFGWIKNEDPSVDDEYQQHLQRAKTKPLMSDLQIWESARRRLGGS